MDTPQKIAKQLEQLPPEMQERVLRIVVSLAGTTPIGEKGADLRQCSKSLDSISAQQMSEAIERECEQVDSSQW
jgi:hypothetical protein